MLCCSADPPRPPRVRCLWPARYGLVCCRQLDETRTPIPPEALLRARVQRNDARCCCCSACCCISNPHAPPPNMSGRAPTARRKAASGHSVPAGLLARRAVMYKLCKRLPNAPAILGPRTSPPNATDSNDDVRPGRTANASQCGQGSRGTDATECHTGWRAPQPATGRARTCPPQLLPQLR